MVSIKDIAKKCGVSVATVSKALNNQSDVSAATKTKIQKVAAEMGYSVNVAARALRTNRTYNLGVLFADDRAGLSHEYFSLILESFQREAERRGYDLTLINHAIAGQKTTYLKHAEYRNLDGVAIITADFSDPEIVELAESKLPVVTIDHIFDRCPGVLSDNSRGVEALVRYIHSMGHRKIAYIHGDWTNVTSERVSGFYKATRQLGLDIPEHYVVRGKYHDIEASAEATKILLDLEDRPTCIIYPDDYSYIGGLNEITSRGMTVGNEISAAGYDGINLAKFMNLTTYEQNTSDLGKLAASKLIRIIEKPDRIPEHVIVTGKLIEGKTVRKLL